MPLILPESAEVAAWKAEQALQVESKVREMEHWDQELKRIDPGLSLVVAKPGSEDEGLMPGRWHVCKHVPNGPDEFWPLVGPNDEYREPGGWILDEFNANDLWDPRVHRSKREAKQKLSEARARVKRLYNEQKADEMKLAYEASQRLRSEAGLKERTDLKGHASRSSKSRTEPSEKP